MNIKLTIYDNGGKSNDRYTVVIDTAVFTMSEDAESPQGVNMYCFELNELRIDAIGQEIGLDQVDSESTKRAIIDRVASYLEGIAEL